MTLKRLWRVTAHICFSVILSSLGPAFSQDCDIAIFNGRVMDPESNFDAVRNVCVKTGRITRFTEDEINSEEIIQARGHVVSPGFIDTQAHSHRNLFGVKFLLRDGVTSPMELEYGNINVDAWYKAREGKWPVNFAAAAAHERHRMRVFDKMPPTDKDGKKLGWNDPYVAYIGHPRTAGSHAATFRLAREHKEPLMHMMAQNSCWTAKHLGDTGLKAMQERGRMQERMIAVITTYNPQIITNNATYTIGSNGLPSTGIPYVMINGTIIVKNSKVLDGVYPGQPIRFPVEEKGGWEHLEKKSYLKNLLQSNNKLDEGLGSARIHVH